jgi:hypothetical protein
MTKQQHQPRAPRVEADQRRQQQIGSHERLWSSDECFNPGQTLPPKSATSPATKVAWVDESEAQRSSERAIGRRSEKTVDLPSECF